MDEDFIRRCEIAMEGYKLMMEEKELTDKHDKSELELHKLKLDITNAKRVSKTYWWTFGMSALALLLSLVLAILKLLGK